MTDRELFCSRDCCRKPYPSEEISRYPLTSLSPSLTALRSRIATASSSLLIRRYSLRSTSLARRWSSGTILDCKSLKLSPCLRFPDLPRLLCDDLFCTRRSLRSLLEGLSVRRVSLCSSSPSLPEEAPAPGFPPSSDRGKSDEAASEGSLSIFLRLRALRPDCSSTDSSIKVAEAEDPSFFRGLMATPFLKAGNLVPSRPHTGSRLTINQ